MKFFVLLAAVLTGSSLALAQNSQPPQILFSRSQTGSAAPQVPASQALQPAAPAITNSERRAVHITAWDMDVHLDPSQESIEVHVRLTLRNDGSAPLAVVPLQLSSTLHFDDADLNGTRLPLTASILPSDADHTGRLTEAAITLPQPLAPHASIRFAVDYGGVISLNDQRLTVLGAPEAQAAASDWDRISPDFTGLRGFGDVVWYPVSSVPAALGDGDKLFTEIGRQKLLDQDATMSLRVIDQFTGDPPNVALLDGRWAPLSQPASMPTAAVPGVITVSLPPTRIGFEAPSLFLARRTVTDSAGLRILALPADQADVQDYITAALRAQSLIHTWLGDKPRAQLTVLDLPQSDEAPAEIGNVLAIPLASGDASRLTPIVAHGLAGAAFWSPRAWLSQGVANFLGTLWIESADGRKAALENLNSERAALALAEPAMPGDGGQDLLHAVSPIYYRTKATYVFWMLRSLIGDDALQAALQAYNPADDTTPDYFERVVERAAHKDLRWFFDNWVYQDRGLPDLSIAGVYISPEAHFTQLVAIDIVNNGYAEASVPVTIQGATTSDTFEVRVPGHGRITHRVIFQEQPTEVQVNDGTVPEVQDSLHIKTITQAPAPFANRD